MESLKNHGMVPFSHKKKPVPLSSSWSKQLHDLHTAIDAELPDASQPFWCDKQDLNLCIPSYYQIQIGWAGEVALKINNS